MRKGLTSPVHLPSTRFTGETGARGQDKRTVRHAAAICPRGNTKRRPRASRMILGENRGSIRQLSMPAADRHPRATSARGLCCSGNGRIVNSLHCERACNPEPRPRSSAFLPEAGVLYAASRTLLASIRKYARVLRREGEFPFPSRRASLPSERFHAAITEFLADRFAAAEDTCLLASEFA